MLPDNKDHEPALFRTHLRMDRYRAQILILQSLVSIVLSYQVLYTPETVLARPVQEILVLGLLSLLGAAFVLPVRLIETRAFTVILLLIDTAITSSIIYATGQQGSDLYLAYFLIILISASMRTLRIKIICSGIIGTLYGVLLYVSQGGVVFLEGHLIRISILLIMGVVYSVLSDSLEQERKGKQNLIDEMSERRKAEEALKDVNHQKDEFLAMLAHELRNPLMAARTATAALRLTPSDKRLHTILDRNLGRLGELVDEVLTADRLASNVELERESLDLGVVIQETVEDARAAAESRDVTVVVDVEPALPFAGDRRLLRSAVGNLVSNAIKFTRAGGTVHVQGKGDDQFVTVQVDDHCGGLPPGDPSKLFEPFVQRSADRSGLGLGLAIVRQAVDAHGGRIDVKDDPGRGCTFTVVLPASPPSPPPVRHRS